MAAKLALAQRSNIVLGFCDTGSEHPDTERFLADCQAWFGQKIEILKSPDYIDTWDVWTKTNYLVGPYGARCTTELKKKVRQSYQRADDEQVFGFTADPREIKRADEFRENNPEVQLWTPLIDAGLSKADCHALIERAGIKRHAMYDLGYKNANCVGCPKGGMGYWNKIRVDFPDTFDRMAAEERRLNISVNRGEIKVDGKRKSIPVFLDELDPTRGDYSAEDEIECGVLCVGAAAMWEEDEDCEV